MVGWVGMCNVLVRASLCVCDRWLSAADTSSVNYYDVRWNIENDVSSKGNGNMRNLCEIHHGFGYCMSYWLPSFPSWTEFGRASLWIRKLYLFPNRIFSAMWQINFTRHNMYNSTTLSTLFSFCFSLSLSRLTRTKLAYLQLLCLLYFTHVVFDSTFIRTLTDGVSEWIG